MELQALGFHASVPCVLQWFSPGLSHHEVFLDTGSNPCKWIVLGFIRTQTFVAL